MILCPLLSFGNHGFNLLIASVLITTLFFNHAVDLGCGGQVGFGNIHQCMQREGGQNDVLERTGGCLSQEPMQSVCTFFGHVGQLGNHVSGTVKPACHNLTLGVNRGGVEDRCIPQFRRRREHGLDDLIGLVQSCFDAFGVKPNELAEEILYRIGKALKRGDLLTLGVDGVQLGTERLV